jgi:hypothetical protein
MSENICFYTSVGDDTSLIEHISSRYDYDIVCNYYGDNHKIYDKLKNKTIYSEKNKLSKFQSLKKIYASSIIDFSQYEYIIAYDDDALIVKGNIQVLIDLAKKNNISIISSAHHLFGKISHGTHIPVNHPYSLRLVNFIEMNFPIFRNDFLKFFMNIYDGILCGYGIDHLYSNLMLIKKNRMAICDDVIIFNPKNSTKIDSLMPIKDRISQFEKYNIDIITPETIEFI